jgi:hypothetical protein
MDLKKYEKKHIHKIIHKYNHTTANYVAKRKKKGRMMEGVNLTMIYCKNFCKCHNVPPVQQ